MMNESNVFVDYDVEADWRNKSLRRDMVSEKKLLHLILLFNLTYNLLQTHNKRTLAGK